MCGTLTCTARVGYADFPSRLRALFIPEGVGIDGAFGRALFLQKRSDLAFSSEAGCKYLTTSSSDAPRRPWHLHPGTEANLSKSYTESERVAYLQG